MADTAVATATGRSEKDVGFVHLRVHSAYSLLEGALPIKKILGKAVADSQPAIAITDTNNLFAALEFSQKAVADGIQPLIGCQLAIDMEDESEGERRNPSQATGQAAVDRASGRRRRPATRGSSI